MAAVVQAQHTSWLTIQCTGVAVRAESEINVAGGNPVIVVVIRLNQRILMGWSSDWLYSLLLERARDTFAEAIRAASERSEPQPKSLVATEHSEWNRDSTMTSGDPIRIWSSDDDFASLLDSMPDMHSRQQDSGSIFSTPSLSWHINSDREQVLICRWIGPRYGNGGWWNIVGQGKTAKLAPAERRGWIS